MIAINPFIQVDVYNEVFSSENARKIAEGYDILVDGTDNFPTRYLINDLCVLTGKPYVYGSIFRFEGQVSVFDARSGPCYRCLFAEPPPPGLVPSCAEGGVFGVLPGTIGTLQATEVIKLVLGVGESLAGRLLLYDALDMSFHTVQLRKNPSCKVCGDHPQVTYLVDYEAFCGVPARGSHVPEGIDEIAPTMLAERLRDGAPVGLLDVRDEVEGQISQIAGARVIPLGQLSVRLGELDPQAEWVVFCRTGVRSARAADLLRKAGFARVLNLRGGINAWAQEVDSSLYTY
jgi:adenylyltransferase/sulfurtransferase